MIASQFREPEMEQMSQIFKGISSHYLSCATGDCPWGRGQRCFRYPLSITCCPLPKAVNSYFMLPAPGETTNRHIHRDWLAQYQI